MERDLSAMISKVGSPMLKSHLSHGELGLCKRGRSPPELFILPRIKSVGSASLAEIASSPLV